MYLKSLHIQGFKTFEQSTTLELAYPIVAIVGPNGSGKSNLVDALRWTLCEQNLRTLRARSMLDLIFSGSATRHPVGYAEADVTLNNEGDVFQTGADTISVGRRIYRSKESDFLIDGHDVQFRDVEDLLASTGLGFRHYPFIGQGEMNRVVTMKPEERKALFEEVAGIAEYKQRKRDTLIKLDETKGNIARVEDLLAELNGNLEHLRVQATAAQNYVELQQHLHELEMDAAHVRYASVQREQERATARLAEAQEKMAEVAADLHARQATYDNLQSVQRKLSAELREKNAALVGSREEAHRLEKELVSAREKAKYLAAEEARLVQQAKDLETSRTQTVKLSGEIAAETSQLRTQEDAAAAELAAQRNAYDELVRSSEERHKDLAQKQADVLQLENEVRQLFNRFNPLKFELDEKRAVIAAEQPAVIGQPAAGQRPSAALRDDLGRKEALLGEQRSAAEKAAQKLVLLQQTAAELEAASREKTAAADAYRTSLKNTDLFMASLERRIREGVSVSRVLDVVELGARKPLLLQLLQEELAIELSDLAAPQLGSSLRRSGRAALALHYAVAGKEPAQGSGAISCAADVVRCTEKAPAAVHELLRWLFIAPSLEEGLAFAGAHPHAFCRIYCEDGFVLDPTLVVRPLHGTIERSFSGKDSSELVRLEAEAREATRVWDEQKKAVTALRAERDAAAEKVRRLESEIKQQRDHLQSLIIEEERRQAVQREHVERLAATGNRIAELEKELAPLHETLTERRAALSKAHVALDAVEKTRQKIETDLLAGKDAVQSLEIRKNSLSGRLQSLFERKTAYEDQITSLGSELASSQDSLAHVRSDRTALGQRVGVLEAQFKERSNALTVLQAGIDHLELDKRHGDEQLNAAAAEMEAVKASRARLEGRTRELEVLLAEDKGKLEQFTAREDFSQLAGRAEPAMSLEQLQTETDHVRKAMTALEPVNMASIKESEDLRVRIAHLMAQDNDLTQSRSKLLALLDALDRRASDLFEHTYAVIAQAFQEKFVKIFDGGEAHLIRQENGELTGIDIDVILPGKRRQPLELLSGGEKALTAAALQFALFKARPSLFYLLDEVDSALDENNVYRFARLLREEKDSQFLVVTHNRETMLAADVLYGVTMQESGVSKVVSLKLEDADEAPARLS